MSTQTWATATTLLQVLCYVLDSHMSVYVFKCRCDTSVMFEGIFTASVKGMYYFRFSMMNNLSATPNSVVSLMKNDQRLASVWDTSGTDANDIGSNAAVIPLEVGDNVYIKLVANRLIYDDAMNYNTFSGFLLFNM